MIKQNTLALLIPIAVLAIPIFFWKYINNEEIKFSMAIFIVIFYGCAIFRILENYLQQFLHAKEEDQIKDRYSWLGILVVIFLLFMFYIYSKRLFEFLNN